MLATSMPLVRVLLRGGPYEEQLGVGVPPPLPVSAGLAARVGAFSKVPRRPICLSVVAAGARWGRAV